jgi:hypothetical protein
MAVDEYRSRPPIINNIGSRAYPPLLIIQHKNDAVRLSNDIVGVSYHRDIST